MNKSGNINIVYTENKVNMYYLRQNTIIFI